MLLLFAIYFLFCVTVSLNIVFPKMAFSFSGSLQSISTGAYHLCGVISDFKRQVYCWGYNADGELGNNNIANSFVPTKVTGINGNDFLTDVTEVSVGEFHSCAVINGGSVFCWGKNHFGQLGNGKSYDELIPTQVMGGNGRGVLADVSQISAGAFHTCAVTSTGSLYCWGDNTYGQLGNNLGAISKFPLQVKNKGEFLTGISQVSAGAFHTCAVTVGGSVYCWGDNTYGQLGNNSIKNSTTPVKVINGNNVFDDFPAVKNISLGMYHTCAVTKSEDLYCWGRNDYYQLGSGDNNNKLYPTKVIGENGDSFLNILSVSAGDNHTCAITKDGNLYCFGKNDYYQLGTGDDYDYSYPTRVIDNTNEYLSNIIQVSLGESYTCAVNSLGELYCWGKNVFGQLGNSNQEDQIFPQKIYDGNGTLPCNFGCCSHWNYYKLGTSCTDKLSLYCGNYSGNYQCYGENGAYSIVCNVTMEDCCNNISYEKIGDECYTGIGLCKTQGSLYCCGGGINGAILCNAIEGSAGDEILNNGLDDDCDGEIDEQGDVLLSVMNEGEGANVVIFEMSGSSSSSSSSTCESGIDYNTTTGSCCNADAPRYVTAKGDGFSYGGEGFGMCCPDTSGLVLCGEEAQCCLSDNCINNICSSGSSSGSSGSSSGSSGSLSNSSSSVVTTNTFTPINTFTNTPTDSGGGASSSSSSVVATNTFTPINTFTNTPTDSGGDESSSSSVAEATNTFTPVNTVTNTPISEDSSSSSSSSVEVTNTPTETVTPTITFTPCVFGCMKSVTVGDEYGCGIGSTGLYCWGNNDVGQLGIGTTYSSNVPTHVVDGMTQVSAGMSNTCAVDSSGDIYCWGDNVLIPTKMTSLSNVSQVSVGGNHACVVMTDSSLYCWGDNVVGQLGNNTQIDNENPIKVKNSDGSDDISGVAQVSAGLSHTCAVMTDSSLYCWGDNTSGQLGDNTTTMKLIPTRVFGINGSGYLSNVKQVSAGFYSTCAITTDGNVYCWGDNNSGQLGDGTTSSGTKKLVPTKVLGRNGIGYLSNIKQVATGISYTCAVSNDGYLYCWGSGRLGYYPNITAFSLPILVGEYTTTWKQVAAVSSSNDSGEEYTCAVSADNSIYCWGSGRNLSRLIYASGSCDCSTDCCTHWNYSNVGESCANGTYQCFGTREESDVVCVESTPTIIPTSTDLSSSSSSSSSSITDTPTDTYTPLPDTPTNTDTPTDTYTPLPDTPTYTFTQTETPQPDTPTHTFTQTETPQPDTPTHTFTQTDTQTYTFTRTNTFTNTIADSDGDGIPDSEDKCPGLDDAATFTYLGENESYYGNTYRNDDDMDEDGTINCHDPCVDNLPIDDPFLGLDVNVSNCEETPKGYASNTKTYTPTFTNTVLPSDTFTKTYTETNTVTPSFTSTDTVHPSDTFTKTYTETNTITPTFTSTNTVLPSDTFTKTNTETKTVTPSFTSTNTVLPSDTFTKTNTETKTVTPSFTSTNTVLPSDTFTKTNTETKTVTPSFTSTNTVLPSDTFTKTNTETKTVTPSFTSTNTMLNDTLEVVTPSTQLTKPVIEKITKRNIRVRFEKFIGASLKDISSFKKDEIKAKYKYLIHFRKVKRLGNKDKNYQLGRKLLILKNKNTHKFKNLDKGVYSLRYRVIISKNEIIKRTKWSVRNFIIF